MMAEDDVNIGTPITVRVNWPIRRHNKRIGLIMQGSVVRCDSGLIAIQRQHYAFSD